MNTVRMVAVRCDEPVLSNVWWPVRIAEDRLRDASVEDTERILTLWLNSTLGLLLLLSVREDTEGSWVGFKKPMLSEMPVLDPDALGQDQREALVRAYDSLAEVALAPISEITGDPVRARIDEAIAETLGLPDLGQLRNMLAHEPILSSSRLGAGQDA